MWLKVRSQWKKFIHVTHVVFKYTLDVMLYDLHSAPQEQVA